MSLADKLVRAYFDYEDFVGSSYYKHCRLFKYHKLLCDALKDPSKLMYPSTLPTNNFASNATEVMAHSHERSSIDSAEERAAALKENKPIKSKTL